MAVIKTAPIVATIRGPVGGVTFTRSRAGAVARARIKPCPSLSTAISQQRAFHSIKVDHWRRVLTNAQRLEWNAAAETVRWINKVGEEYTPSGYQLFMRQAQGRLDAPYTLPSTPVYPLKCPPPPLILTWNEVLDRIYINTPTNFLPPASGYLMRWYSPANPVTHYHVAGPWTYAGIWTFAKDLPFEQFIRIADWVRRPSRFYLRLRTLITRYTQSDPVVFAISLPPEP